MAKLKIRKKENNNKKDQSIKEKIKGPSRKKGIKWEPPPQEKKTEENEEKKSKERRRKKKIGPELIIQKRE